MSSKGGLAALRDRLRKRAIKYSEKSLKRSGEVAPNVAPEVVTSPPINATSETKEQPERRRSWSDAKQQLSRPNSRAGTPRLEGDNDEALMKTDARKLSSKTPADASLWSGTGRLADAVNSSPSSRRGSSSAGSQEGPASSAPTIDRGKSKARVVNGEMAVVSRESSLLPSGPQRGEEGLPTPARRSLGAAVSELAREGFGGKEKSLDELEMTLKNLSMMQGEETSAIAMLARGSQKVNREGWSQG